MVLLCWYRRVCSLSSWSGERPKWAAKRATAAT
jgi:hypothetical protein